MYSVIHFKGNSKSLKIVLDKWIFKEGKNWNLYWPGAQSYLNLMKSNSDVGKDWKIEKVVVKRSGIGKF